MCGKHRTILPLRHVIPRRHESRRARAIFHNVPPDGEPKMRAAIVTSHHFMDEKTGTFVYHREGDVWFFMKRENVSDPWSCDQGELPKGARSVCLEIENFRNG